MLTISDDFDIDAVLELAVGWISRHGFDVELCLAMPMRCKASGCC